MDCRKVVMGLVVPVIRNAEKMNFAEIEKEINTLAKKANDGTISIDEMAGGSFTISNGGVYGSLLSTPIINPPQSAILGMHSIVSRPMVVGGQVVPRPMMYIALTYDHRLIDGREAVFFLRRIKDVVEDPRSYVHREADRDKYRKEYEAARSLIADLESENKDLSIDREDTHEELKSPVQKLNQSSMCLGRAFEVQSEPKEAIYLSNLVMNEAEKDKSALILAKDEELQVVIAAVMQAQEQFEEMSNQLAAQLQETTNLKEQSHFVDFLRFELEREREAVKGPKEITRGMQSVKEERDGLHHQLELAMNEKQKTKKEAINEIQDREKDLQIEIAMLRSELHRGRAETAAAVAAEARIRSVKSGLYLAVQELAIEIEETRRENQNLKAAAAERVDGVVETTISGESVPEAADMGKADSSDLCFGITIPMEEYDSVIQTAEKADKLANPPSPDASHLLQYGNENGLQELKKELEVARLEIEDLRRAAEQAASRAEQAEAAKAAIENQLREWREQKQKRRAALAAFREESGGDSHPQPPIYDSKPVTYQPRANISDMKNIGVLTPTLEECPGMSMSRSSAPTTRKLQIKILNKIKAMALAIIGIPASHTSQG
ncbi:hypothetical protein ACLOJK_019080 [Asimina triloba]